jgi:hypothetical protein
MLIPAEHKTVRQLARVTAESTRTGPGDVPRTNAPPAHTCAPTMGARAGLIAVAESNVQRTSAGLTRAFEGRWKPQHHLDP